MEKQKKDADPVCGARPLLCVSDSLVSCRAYEVEQRGGEPEGCREQLLRGAEFRGSPAFYPFDDFDIGLLFRIPPTVFDEQRQRVLPGELLVAPAAQIPDFACKHFPDVRTAAVVQRRGDTARSVDPVVVQMIVERINAPRSVYQPVCCCHILMRHADRIPDSIE